MLFPISVRNIPRSLEIIHHVPWPCAPKPWKTPGTSPARHLCPGVWTLESRFPLGQNGGRFSYVVALAGVGKTRSVSSFKSCGNNFENPVHHFFTSLNQLMMAEMDPEVAKRLHNEGATLIVSDVPEGTEFGIDYFSCNVGPRFKGIKMIPPGLHFIYYSAVNRGGQSAPRTGLFLFSKRQDVFVLRWDPSTEDVVEVDVNEEEKDKYRQGINTHFSSLGLPFFFSCKVLTVLVENIWMVKNKVWITFSIDPFF